MKKIDMFNEIVKIMKEAYFLQEKEMSYSEIKQIYVDSKKSLKELKKGEGKE